MQPEVHWKIQSGEKTNKCKQCDFRSSQASNLRARLKIHSGEKSHKCNQCDYKSSGVEVLRGHLKTHRGEKPNKLCILSNRPFKETNENTKKCNHCVYASSRVEKLMIHLKGQTLIMTFSFPEIYQRSKMLKSSSSSVMISLEYRIKI